MEQNELEDIIRAEAEKQASPQEETPETKIETEQPTETKVEPKEPEVEPIKEKTEQKVRTIPLSAHIRAEKEYKAKIAELSGELERTKQGSQPTSAEIEEILERYGVEDTNKPFFKDLVNAIESNYESKYSDKFKALDEYQSKSKEQQEQQELVEYIDKQVNDISDLVQKEHGNNATEVLNKLKIKILQEGLYATPPELVYKGFEEFKPIKKKMSAETSSPSPKTEVFDKENATMEDIRAGKISALDYIDTMRHKYGQD